MHRTLKTGWPASSSDDMLQRRYANHVLLVANAPAEVRCCDVERLIDEVPQGIDLRNFMVWLRDQVPAGRMKDDIDAWLVNN
jgi:hypothetical protein